MFPKSMKNRPLPVSAAKPILNTGLEGEWETESESHTSGLWSNLSSSIQWPGKTWQSGQLGWTGHSANLSLKMSSLAHSSWWHRPRDWPPCPATGLGFKRKQRKHKQVNTANGKNMRSSVLESSRGASRSFFTSLICLVSKCGSFLYGMCVCLTLFYLFTHTHTDRLPMQNCYILTAL